MNLPIKLIDIVTLLFLTLLVVIIIFITLQRNIKRYKLRNIKDPHFHICKSIPKELRDNIANKHSKSNVYKEPPQLFTNTYHYLKPDRTQSFVLRLKAFDTSKNLENALYDCGFIRSIGTKFEDFLFELLDENTLPKSLLKQFLVYYKWILTDPKVFELKDLREMYLLINKIIEHLATKFQNDQIKKHKLELDQNGDYNLEMKLNTNYSSDNLSNYTNSQLNSNSNNNNESSLARKLFKNLSKLKLSKTNKMNESEVLFKKSSENKAKTKSDKSNLIDKECRKNEIKNIDELGNLTRWSLINESIKFNDDSENEEIPLVIKDSERKNNENSGKFNHGFNKKLDTKF